MYTDATRSEEELVERLYEAADAVEDEDVRDTLYKAISAALEVWAPKTLDRVQRGELAKVEKPPIQDGVTNHTLRRTFASLLYEAGASPAYVMSQMGHASSALALEIYARKMERSRDTGARMDALISGADWNSAESTSSEQGATSKPALTG